MNFKTEFNKPLSSIESLQNEDYRNEFIEKKYQKTIYLTHSKLGFSLEFDGDSIPILISIHLYSPAFISIPTYTDPLPFSLSWNSTAEEIVSKLGEPIRKEGGGGVEIRLGYDNIGIELTLGSKIWQDANAKLVALAIFQTSNSNSICALCRNPASIECKCKSLKYCSQKCNSEFAIAHSKYCI